MPTKEAGDSCFAGEFCDECGVRDKPDRRLVNTPWGYFCPRCLVELDTARLSQVHFEGV